MGSQGNSVRFARGCLGLSLALCCALAVGRSLALNTSSGGVIFAIFALIFSYTGASRHVAGSPAIAITAWIATASTYKRSLRHRPGENQRTLIDCA